MIGSDLLRFSDRKTIVFDFETQRLNTLEDNLVFQCAWVITQKGRIIERHNHYLHWPNFKMSVDAARITRFNPDWVKYGDDPKEVLTKWESFALDESYYLAGHNVFGFDIPIWQLWRRQFGMKPDWSVLNRTLDTHLLSRAYKMNKKPERANLKAWFYKMAANRQQGIKTGLALMAAELGIPVDEARLHDADYDLDLNAGVMWKLANLMEI